MEEKELCQLIEGLLVVKHDPGLPNEKMDQLETAIIEGKFRYKMKKMLTNDDEKRGKALVINNALKAGDDILGPGSVKDVACMKEVLTNLNFDVITRTSQSVAEMKKLFESMRDTIHTEYDSFVTVIISHGGDGDVVYGGTGIDPDDKIEVTELIEYMLPQNCPTLTGKPKLFFIEACRGSKPDPGKEVYDDPVGKVKKIPTWADVLLSQSTVPGYYAWGNATGTWFLHSLAAVLKKHAKDKEITELLTMVNYMVAHLYESCNKAKPQYHGLKQMSSFTSMLTRQLYL